MEGKENRDHSHDVLLAYFNFLSGMITFIIVFCSLMILVVGALLLLLQFWIQQKVKKAVCKKKNDDKQLFVGFFHPYCNAGGGGERVLWTAIKALQMKYSHVECIVYTGDTDATSEEILSQVEARFNIQLTKPVEFVFLTRRRWVEASMYPYFTLLGQSLGSMYLAFEALFMFVPDVYIDSMGYAFTLPLFKYFGGCRIACYVHYPTISTDMLERVSNQLEAHNNRFFISRSPLLSAFKLRYYQMFASLYGLVGRCSDIVLVNSSWTRGHILSLWNLPSTTFLVYPPCDVKELKKISLEKNSIKSDCLKIISIGQFRPEKDHPLQIKAFSEFLKRSEQTIQPMKLVIVGSCRNKEDEERVNQLQDLCYSLDIVQNVEFKINISYSDLLLEMKEAVIGLHTMWNEHFGIGVVECMAAGLITIAHNSGGPKLDIVVEYNGKPTGFLAHDEKTYADAFDTVIKLTKEEQLEIRKNARASVSRFSEEEFQSSFLSAIEHLIRPKSKKD